MAPCEFAVFQSLPQSTEHLAWALFDEATDCLEDVVKPAFGLRETEDGEFEGTLDPLQMNARRPQGAVRPNSYGRKIHLDFYSTLSLQAQDLPYHVCSETTWQQGIDTISEVRDVETKGPVDTYVFFYNSCPAPRMLAFDFVPARGTCS